MKILLPALLTMALFAGCAEPSQSESKSAGADDHAAELAGNKGVSKAKRKIFSYWSETDKDSGLASTPFSIHQAETLGYTQASREGCVYIHQVPGTVPLYAYYSGNKKDAISAAHPETLAAVAEAGYVQRLDQANSPIVEGYVWPADSNKQGNRLHLHYLDRGEGQGESLQTTNSKVNTHAPVRIEAILPHCGENPVDGKNVSIEPEFEFKRIGNCKDIFGSNFTGNNNICQKAIEASLAPACENNFRSESCDEGSQCIKKGDGAVFECKIK